MTSLPSKFSGATHTLCLRFGFKPVSYDDAGEPLGYHWVDFKAVTDEEVTVLRDVYRRGGGRMVMLDGRIMEP